MGVLEESGATPLTQIRDGRTATCHPAKQTMHNKQQQYTHMIAKRVIHLVPDMMVVWLSQLVEELVKDGRPGPWWENTTIAGTHMGILMVSGVTLPRDWIGSTVLFQNVNQCERLEC